MTRQSLGRHLWVAFQDWNPLPTWPLVWRKDAVQAELSMFHEGRDYERRARAGR